MQQVLTDGLTLPQEEHGHTVGYYVCPCSQRQVMPANDGETRNGPWSNTALPQRNATSAESPWPVSASEETLHLTWKSGEESEQWE